MLEAFFLPVDPGQRFCILSTPAGAARRAVVYIHPFAEEMNKARRMAALQARQLAAEGCVVLQIDLLGCGDSSGEFSEARWHAWQRDAQTAVRWISRRYPVPVTLWGLRLGAMLAADVAQDASLGIEHLILWQPVSNGGQFLSQFVRLRLASEMLASGAATTALRELTEELRRGGMLEIAGYELHADLAVGAWQHAGAAVSGGRIYVHSGKDGRLLRTITGRIPGDTLGFDSVGIGDVDGDGMVDLLVTSAYSGIIGYRSGRLFVVSSGVPRRR